MTLLLDQYKEIKVYYLFLSIDTFFYHCRINKMNQSFPRSYCPNSRLHNSLSLTQRGLNQAHRNDSK